MATSAESLIAALDADAIDIELDRLWQVGWAVDEDRFTTESADAHNLWGSLDQARSVVANIAAEMGTGSGQNLYPVLAVAITVERHLVAVCQQNAAGFGEQINASYGGNPRLTTDHLTQIVTTSIADELDQLERAGHELFVAICARPDRPTMELADAHNLGYLIARSRAIVDQLAAALGSTPSLYPALRDAVKSERSIVWLCEQVQAGHVEPEPLPQR